jgi:hypothetical protein
MFGSTLDAPPDVSSVMVPHDRARSFADCDGWIVFGDSTLGAIAWLRPAIIVAPQLAERYVPAFSGQADIECRIDTFLSWRRARMVLGVTEADLGDLVSFAGVHPERVRQLPPLRYDLLSRSDKTCAAIDRSAIIWHPAFSWKTPILTVARAWREYLEAGGTLPLWIIGRHADAAASEPAVVSILDECSRMHGHWQTCTVLPGRRLDRLLDRARILWNPSVADDGHWLVARALERGIPTVAAEAPHLRGGPLESNFGTSILWTHAAHDVVAAGGALLAASTALPLESSEGFPYTRSTFSSMLSWRELLVGLSDS